MTNEEYNRSIACEIMDTGKVQKEIDDLSEIDITIGGNKIRVVYTMDRHGDVVDPIGIMLYDNNGEIIYLPEFAEDAICAQYHQMLVDEINTKIKQNEEE